MKNLFVLMVIVALAFPYARKHFPQYFTFLNNGSEMDAAGLAAQLNQKLPRMQGLLSFHSAVSDNGSVIVNVEDNINPGVQLTVQQAQDRINTWQPFLIAQTCRNAQMRAALEGGKVQNIFYRFIVPGVSVDYGRAVVSNESCL